jgi:lipoprotein-anchoring transpeptidase ErfK/SrfK
MRVRVWRAIAVCLVLAATGAAAAFAQDSTTTGTTGTDPATTTEPVSTTDATTTTDTEPPPSPEPPPPEPPRIAEGVSVAGLAVGGMTAEEAAAALYAYWRRPLVLTFRARTWTPRPAYVGASTDISAAVARALAAGPYEALTLPIAINRTTLRTYIKRRARELYRPPVNSRVYLRSLRPYVTRGRPGRRVLYWPTRYRILAELRAHERGPVEIPTAIIRQRITRSNFGPVVVIRRESHRLYLYNSMTFWRSFGVATGMPQYPTPLGRFHIVSKVRWPWWYPPDAAWAAGASPVPPGPNNPLGTRWMGLSVGGVGIHGTPSAWSIGYSASHGCIRMRIPEAEWLFERVRIGTTVFIVRA